jgi:hypothetical protein
MAKRKGFLTPKTFFPKSGDVYVSPTDDEIPARECARANQWIDEKTGDKVRYALIVGRHDEYGVIPQTVHEGTDMDDFLAEYSSIHRAGKEYARTENGTFVEV